MSVHISRTDTRSLVVLYSVILKAERLQLSVARVVFGYTVIILTDHGGSNP